MAKNRPYAAVHVKDVNLEQQLRELEDRPVWVGIDVSKEHLMVALCWGEGLFSRPWKVPYPQDLGLLVHLLKKLAEGRSMVIGLEPTGSYADPLRWALTKAKLDVRRIDSKISHDYGEIFDSTPSQHDGKDAAALAELARLGKCRPWPLSIQPEREVMMRSLVEAADDQQRVLSIWIGRLEALLARYWPEAPRILDLSSSTMLRMLMEYGVPQRLAEDAEGPDKLRKWGRNLLSEEKIEAVVHSARTSAGVPASSLEVQRIQQCAQYALVAEQDLQASKRELAKLCEGDVVLERMGRAVGLATAGVFWVMLGDPGKYPSPKAYLKAAGLNLTERSSGKYLGELRISKRGPALVRRWLYLAAVRLLRYQPAARWFQRKRERDGGRRGSRRKGVGLIGLVALMRRLLGAVWQVTRHRSVFNVHRLFGRPQVARMT